MARTAFPLNRSYSPAPGRQIRTAARTDTELRPGDALLFDFGAQVSGYNADITRTFFVGHVTDEHAAIYGTVLDANELGRARCGPGLTAHDLDTEVTGVLQGFTICRADRAQDRPRPRAGCA